MAILIYLYGRDGSANTYSDKELTHVVERILPDNAPKKVVIEREEDRLVCVSNLSEGVSIHEGNVCLGKLIPSVEWSHRYDLEGNFAIVRGDPNQIEVISDAAATKTLYYRILDDIFVVSSSQRAVMHFSDDLDLDKEALLWMISSGTLGPKQTWDRRVKFLPPDTRLSLDRSKWRLNKYQNPILFDPKSLPREKQLDLLGSNLDSLYSKMDLDFSKWVLPISGGVDSRELLHVLKDEEALKTVTWGNPDALEDTQSDAYIAQRVVEAYGVPHRFFSLPKVPEKIDTFFERFVVASEGRIDHIAGYTDGFSMFEKLVSEGYGGMIRGDHGFGSKPAETPFDVRSSVCLQTLDDYIVPSIDDVFLTNHQLPKRFLRRPGESLSTWKDRLRHSYRLPCVLAPLNSIKSPYMEVVSPYLTKQILRFARNIPSEYRVGKKIWRDHVLSKGPEIKLAQSGATLSVEKILRHPSMVSYLSDSIDKDSLRELTGDRIVDDALQRMKEGVYRRNYFYRLKSQMVKRLPSKVLTPLVKSTNIELPKICITGNRLALRLFLIRSTLDKLSDDIEVIR